MVLAVYSFVSFITRLFTPYWPIRPVRKKYFGDELIDKYGHSIARVFVTFQNTTKVCNLGCIVGSDGLILTNWYGQGTAVQSIRIQLYDLREFDGVIEYVYHHTLATIRIPCNGLMPLTLGTTTNIRNNEGVVGGEDGIVLTITTRYPNPDAIAAGLVCATINGEGGQYIVHGTVIGKQLGGPLLNLDGDVVGINALDNAEQKLTFSVPIDRVKAFLNQHYSAIGF